MSFLLLKGEHSEILPVNPRVGVIQVQRFSPVFFGEKWGLSLKNKTWEGDVVYFHQFLNWFSVGSESIKSHHPWVRCEHVRKTISLT